MIATSICYLKRMKQGRTALRGPRRKTRRAGCVERNGCVCAAQRPVRRTRLDTPLRTRPHRRLCRARRAAKPRRPPRRVRRRRAGLADSAVRTARARRAPSKTTHCSPPPVTCTGEEKAEGNTHTRLDTTFHTGGSLSLARAASLSLCLSLCLCLSLSREPPLDRSRAPFEKEARSWRTTRTASSRSAAAASCACALKAWPWPNPQHEQYRFARRGQSATQTERGSVRARRGHRAWRGRSAALRRARRGLS